MNCPYCGSSMKHGQIRTNAVLHILHHPADIVFEPDDYLEKRKVSLALARREGWYCESCRKIVGIFDVSL